MAEEFSRAQLLLGEEAMQKLAAARVAVFGVGGVGGYAVEALARAGIGALDLIDRDTVSLSNINRQIIALHSTVGRYKAEVAAERVADISPACKVTVHNTFFLPSTAEEFDFTQYDYVIDAIDTVTGKLALAERAMQANVPIISAMGAGNKLDATAFRVADISQTSVCPLAKVMRRELRKRGIEHLKVVYSAEPPKQGCAAAEKETAEGENMGEAAMNAEKAPLRTPPGSVSFVPPVVGLILAGEVVKDLTGIR